jgi:hypothetical protein
VEFQILIVLTYISGGVGGIVCRCTYDMQRVLRMCSNDVS